MNAAPQTMAAANVAAPRRGLSRIEAARYVGISATKFDALVKDGRMPRPKRIDGRVVWDVRCLDLAFDDLPDDSTAQVADTWADFH
jgi:predicted DNA-binding transcriptional regulator AlpA